MAENQRLREIDKGLLPNSVVTVNHIRGRAYDPERVVFGETDSPKLRAAEFTSGFRGAAQRQLVCTHPGEVTHRADQRPAGEDGIGSDS